MKGGKWSRDHWWGYAWIQSPSLIPLMVNLEELVVTSMTVSLINVNTMVLEVQSPFCYNILIGHINKKLYVVRHQYNIVLRKHFKLEIDSAYLNMQLCILMKSIVSHFKINKTFRTVWLGSEWWKFDLLKIHFSSDFSLEGHLLWSIIS